MEKKIQDPKNPKVPEGPFSRPDFDFMKKFYRYTPIAFLILTPIFYFQNPPRDLVDWIFLPVTGLVMAMFSAGALLVAEVVFLRSNEFYRKGMIFHPLFLLTMIKTIAFIAVLMAILFFNENKRIALGIILFGSGLYGLAAYLLTYCRKKMAKK